MAPIETLLDTAIRRHRSGELAAAEEIYRKILKQPPENADARHLLGVVAHQRGEHEHAARQFERAIRIDGAHGSYHSNLGAAYRELGRIDAAVDCFRRAIALEPRNPGFLYNLGNALRDAGRLRNAVECYRQAIALHPEFAEAHNNLGGVLTSLGRHDEAIVAHRRAIALRAEFPEAWFNLGNAHRGAERFADAAESYQQAVRQNPAYTDAWINLGFTHEDQGDLAAAIECYDFALRACPDCADAHFNRALSWLQLGDFGRGWDEYEWRWHRSSKDRAKPSGTEWDGSSLSGKRIHIYNEQGIGDEVMFASCFADLLETRPAGVVVECDPRLQPLFQRSFPEIAFVPRRGTESSNISAATDVLAAAGSLPRFFRRSPADFPGHDGYLQADASLVAEWKRRYHQAGGKITVGISWRGGRDETARWRRSTSIEQWQPLWKLPGIQFVNLQYGACRAEADLARSMYGANVLDGPAPDPLHDLDGFAAQIAALDLVISVDNSTVHLAGALGVPVWTLLPGNADWRWLVNRDDTPWYPCMRLFRQPEFGDWDSVFDRVARELAKDDSPSATRRQACPTSERSHVAITDSPRSEMPASAAELNDRAINLQTEGCLDEALALLLQARERAPRESAIAYNLGNLYRRMNRPEQAVQSYELALDLNPDSVEAHVNRGVALREAGRLPEAEATFDRVLTERPDLPEAHFNRALVRLQRGDFARGWPEYEWRWHTGPDADPQARRVVEPIELSGRRLLVRAEQGIGDEIMFASCLPDAARQAESCVIECDRRLAPLFARSFPFAAVVPKPVDIDRPIRDGKQGHLLEWDLCLPCGSLPAVLRPNEEAFPRHSGYLMPDAERVALWRSRVAELGGELAVGISWSGGKDAETRRRRSIPLMEWRDIFAVDGARFINLQYGKTPADLLRLGNEAGATIHHWPDSDPLAKIDDFAAQIASLDLVISVDNCTVHFAGALGVPVWTLLPAAADWRWIQDRDDSPWYPSMRLFRQTESANWSDVLKQVSRELKRRLG